MASAFEGISLAKIEYEARQIRAAIEDVTGSTLMSVKLACEDGIITLSWSEDKIKQ